MPTRPAAWRCARRTRPRSEDLRSRSTLKASKVTAVGEDLCAIPSGRTCPSGLRCRRCPVTPRRGVGLRARRGRSCCVLTPLVGRARAADRRPGPTRPTARACTRSRSRASAGWRSSPGSSIPARDLRRPRRPLPRASSSARCCVAALGLFDDTRGIAPEPSSCVGVAADRADPGRRLRRDARALQRCRCSGLRPRLGRLSADDPLDRAAREPREPDRRHGLRWPPGSSRSRRASFAILAGLLRPHGRRRAGRDRVRRDAGVPAPQLPPGEDLHGRLRGARARLPARRAVGRRRAQDRRDDHPRRRRCSCSRCRSSTRRSSCSSGSSTAAPPWGADHNHFYHRFMRIGFSQRRTAAYLHLWALLLAAYALLAPLRAAAPARRLGPRELADRAARRPARDRRRRSGWSTRSRSSRAATCRPSACAASAGTSRRGHRGRADDAVERSARSRHAR